MCVCVCVRDAWLVRTSLDLMNRSAPLVSFSLTAVGSASGAIRRIIDESIEQIIFHLYIVLFLFVLIVTQTFWKAVSVVGGFSVCFFIFDDFKADIIGFWRNNLPEELV